MNLQEIYYKFPTLSDCIEHLEKVRWNGDPRCPYCGSDRNSPMQERRHCNSCHTSFRVTVGTVFHHTHLPLQKWFLALSLMLNAKQRITALQLSKDLKVNKNTALRIQRQIRKALTQADQCKLMIGLAEMAEACIGGNPKPSPNHRRVQGSYGLEKKVPPRNQTSVQIGESRHPHRQH